MKRLIPGAVAILLLSAYPATAELIVDAGSWNLQPNTAGQEILVSISGVGSVTNATVIEEIVGISPLPIFTGGSIVDGTIFASNNTGYPTYDFSSPQLAYLDVATNTGTVDGNGILAKLTVSTEGVTSGDFLLKLLDTSWDDTYVGTPPVPVVNVTYNAGSIHIVPEPGTLILLASLLALLPAVVWRRKRLAM